MLQKNCLAIAIVIVTALISSFANAATETRKKTLYGVMHGGITFGGDELLTVQYSGQSDEEIEAGGLLFIGVGFATRPTEDPVSFQLTLNYHTDFTNADNGDASFSRWPVDAIIFFGHQHRVGVGLSYHINPELDVDFDFGSGKVDFDDAVGFLVEYNYQFEERMFMGLRYNAITYEVENTSIEVDGNHLGLVFSLLF